MASRFVHMLTVCTSDLDSQNHHQYLSPLQDVNNTHWQVCQHRSRYWHWHRLWCWHSQQFKPKTCLFAPLTHSFTHLLTLLLFHPLTHSFTHLLTLSLTHTLIHSLTHPLDNRAQLSINRQASLMKLVKLNVTAKLAVSVCACVCMCVIANEVVCVLCMCVIASEVMCIYTVFVLHSI